MSSCVWADRLVFFVVFIAYVYAAIAAGGIAGSKGSSTIGWCLAGIVFGPFALIAAIGIPDEIRSKKYEVLIQQQQAILDELKTLNAR